MSQVAVDRRERQKQEQRRELVRAAHALVREEGYDALTIRKLATRAGYAPMSVYSYFADKHAILVALAEDHFEILAEHLRRDYPGAPLDVLKQGLLDYVAFGLENSNEYRTVFMTGGIKDKAEYEQIQQNNPALKCLMERVGDVIVAGQLHGDVFAISTMLWTAAHGVTALLITHPHYPFGDRHDYARRVIDTIITGLAASPVTPLKSAPTEP